MITRLSGQPVSLAFAAIRSNTSGGSRLAGRLLF
jgi:hypothetical protein